MRYKNYYFYCFALLIASLATTQCLIAASANAKLPVLDANNQTNNQTSKKILSKLLSWDRNQIAQAVSQPRDPQQVQEWENLNTKAETLYNQKNYRDAQYWYEILYVKSQEINYSAGEIIALIGVARSNLGQNNYDLAWQNIQKAESILVKSNLRNPIQANRILELKGQITEAKGDDNQALNYYLSALDWYETQWLIYQPVDLWRSHWSKEAAPLYYRTTQLLLKHDPSRAFKIAELDKARGLTYHMTYGPLNPLRYEYTKRQVLRQLQAQIDLTDEPTQSLIDSYDQYRRSVQAIHPDIVGRTKIIPPSVTEVQELLQQLDPQVTIVSYTITEEMVIAFVISVDQFAAVKLEITPSDLNKAINEFNLSNNSNSSSSSLPLKRLKNHQYLYKHLIKPLLKHFKTERLGIIPHRYLQQVPFAILQNDTQKYLDETYELFYLPNTSFLRLLAQKYPIVQRSYGNNPQILIMASPWHRNSPITDKVIAEAKTIADIYQQEPYLYTKATAVNFWRLAPQSDVIHIASHAIFNEKNSLWSKIILHSDQNHRGQIYLHELYDRLYLERTDLVVLSACQTNKSNLDADGDEHITISRAFLAAGARTVISSFWLAKDNRTSQLMSQFYRNYHHAGLSKLRAIREAQRDLRKTMQGSSEWSNFSLIGDWR